MSGRGPPIGRVAGRDYALHMGRYRVPCGAVVCPWLLRDVRWMVNVEVVVMRGHGVPFAAVVLLSAAACGGDGGLRRMSPSRLHRAPT